MDNLLSKGFDIVINFTRRDLADSSSSSSEGSVSSTPETVELRKLRKRWPNCQPVLQKAIKRQVTKDKNKKK